MTVVLAGALATTLTPAWGAGTDVDFTVAQVMVNRMGGITATGTVDCTDQVLEKWGAVPPSGIWVMINVDGTAYQRQGRRIIKASLGDPEPVKPCETPAHEVQTPGASFLGSLIQTWAGTRAACGGPLTKRSGWAA